MNQKQELIFQEVGGLVTKNISLFCLEGVAHYFKAMPNSVALYIGIFMLFLLVYVFIIKQRRP